MYTKTLILILTIVFLATLATAKPLVKQDSELQLQDSELQLQDSELQLQDSKLQLQESELQLQDSKLHKLIKRATVGEKGSSKTMFAAVTATKQSPSRKKTRECEEWSNKNFTKQWKCIKFIVVSKEN